MAAAAAAASSAAASSAAATGFATSAALGQLKTISGGKDLRVACTTCTFLNASEAETCEMCGATMAPTAHEVQASGAWKCGSCATLNGKGVKECCECRLPFYARVTSAAPSQIFCPRCGFLNDGANVTCVQCDTTIRSTLEKLGTDLRDSTNFLARDMGVNIHVKCPGCLLVCFVPPATACLRCGACHTYFASPTVGEVTNFHVTRLASSISSSFMGLFGQKQPTAAAVADPERNAPVGRLIALGKEVVKSPRRRSTSPPGSTTEAEQPPASQDLGEEEGGRPDPDEAKPSVLSSSGGGWGTGELRGDVTPDSTATPAVAKSETSATPQVTAPLPTAVAASVPATGVAAADSKAEMSKSASNLSRSTKLKPLEPLPPMARSLPVREALPAPPQDLIQVEGDIVEL